MRALFLIFIIVPIVEMLLLFEVSDHIGGLSTVGLVVLTAAIGIQILKQQGLSTFSRANRRLESGELPGQEIIEGLFLAVGGAFLLTPGLSRTASALFFLSAQHAECWLAGCFGLGKYQFLPVLPAKPLPPVISPMGIMMLTGCMRGSSRPKNR